MRRKKRKTSSLIKDNIYSEKKKPDDNEKNPIYMLLIDL